MVWIDKYKSGMTCESVSSRSLAGGGDLDRVSGMLVSLIKSCSTGGQPPMGDSKKRKQYGTSCFGSSGSRSA
jgi:hypothetical protein